MLSFLICNPFQLSRPCWTFVMEVMKWLSFHVLSFHVHLMHHIIIFVLAFFLSTLLWWIHVACVVLWSVVWVQQWPQTLSCTIAQNPSLIIFLWGIIMLLFWGFKNVLLLWIFFQIFVDDKPHWFEIIFLFVLFKTGADL